jgi:hypothetical protein
LSAALRVAVVGEVTGADPTANVVLEAPEGTVAVGGGRSDSPVVEIGTAYPAAGAGPSRVSVAIAGVPPPVRVVGLIVSADTAVGFTLTVAVLTEPW